MVVGLAVVAEREVFSRWLSRHGDDTYLPLTSISSCAATSCETHVRAALCVSLRSVSSVHAMIASSMTQNGFFYRHHIEPGFGVNRRTFMIDCQLHACDWLWSVTCREPKMAVFFPFVGFGTLQGTPSFSQRVTRPLVKLR